MFLEELHDPRGADNLVLELHDIVALVPEHEQPSRHELARCAREGVRVEWGDWKLKRVFDVEKTATPNFLHPQD